MKQGKLLIADDSEMNRAILANILDRDFELIEVSNGKEALHALQIYHREISLFLLDIVMPELDGFEVLKEMRLKGWIKEIPTIMISAETGNTYIDRAFELGAADYISRPFAPSIIRRRIENVLLLYGQAPQLQEVFSKSFYQPKKSEKHSVHDDPAASRIIKRLEEANSKLDFFNHLCKEIWFEYAKESGKLYLSEGAVERTGLPSILQEPLEYTELAEFLGEETIGRLRERLRKVTAEEEYLEVPVKVRLSGEVCHCQLVMQILWSGNEDGYFSRLFGKVMEIEPDYRRLQIYRVAAEDQVEKQLLLPVMAGEDGVLHITGKQVGQVMQSYHSMFQTVRLIDTKICMQVSTDRKGHIVEKRKHCY